MGVRQGRQFGGGSSLVWVWRLSARLSAGRDAGNAAASLHTPGHTHVVALPAPVPAEDLVVRPYDVADAPLLQTAVLESIDHLRPWMPWVAQEPITLTQRAEMIAGWQALWDSGDRLFGMFAGGEIVGGCGLHRRVGPGGLEIGYWVRVGRTGRGYATEAARQLTAMAFADPDVTHVEIHHDVTNLASGRIPAKLGFTVVGRIRRTPAAPAETGTEHVWRLDRP
jgi:ribosomal-protein-serine acetyltransferase